MGLSHSSLNKIQLTLETQLWCSAVSSEPIAQRLYRASNDLSERWIEVEGQVRVHIESRANPGHFEALEYIHSIPGVDGADHRSIQGSHHGFKTMHNLPFYGNIFISLMLVDTFTQLRNLLRDSGILCGHGRVRG